MEHNPKVQAQIARFITETPQQTEYTVAQKRINWFHQQTFKRRYPPTPRGAYELLFFAYMGLQPAELEVVEESDERIVWRSTNPCPTLEACRSSSLDTRVVCRSRYERSTQALISMLDPQLRFGRSYIEIRPWTPYCLEWIVRVSFAEMLAAARAECLRIAGNSDGALINRGRDILAAATDQPEKHAAAVAIHRARQVDSFADLRGAILFSTTIPCLKCIQLAANARLTSIVYNVSDAPAGSTVEQYASTTTGWMEVIPCCDKT